MLQIISGPPPRLLLLLPEIPIVQLGKSGVKISKIVLGCMSYGTPDWQSWALDAGRRGRNEVHQSGI
ncbi:aryl-alcohol dehydrogenase [Moniliophthora roreri]|nr:aryl-alcohol dehydrogenase [Moniliophthora roreri]